MKPLDVVGIHIKWRVKHIFNLTSLNPLLSSLSLLSQPVPVFSPDSSSHLSHLSLSNPVHSPPSHGCPVPIPLPRHLIQAHTSIWTHPSCFLAILLCCLFYVSPTPHLPVILLSPRDQSVVFPLFIWNRQLPPLLLLLNPAEDLLMEKTESLCS